MAQKSTHKQVFLTRFFIGKNKREGTIYLQLLSITLQPPIRLPSQSPIKLYNIDACRLPKNAMRVLISLFAKASAAAKVAEASTAVPEAEIGGTELAPFSLSLYISLSPSMQIFHVDSCMHCTWSLSLSHSLSLSLSLSLDSR